MTALQVGSRVCFTGNAPIIWNLESLRGKLATVVSIKEIPNPHEESPPTTIQVELKWDTPHSLCFNHRDPLWNIGAFDKGWFDIIEPNEWEGNLELL